MAESTLGNLTYRGIENVIYTNTIIGGDKHNIDPTFEKERFIEKWELHSSNKNI
jgi:hypothetical protein